MRLRVGERERAAPRASEHQPALDAVQGAQPLDVGHEVPGRVGVEAGIGPRAPAPPLVEQEQPIAVGVEELPMNGAASAARSAMEEDGGLSLRISAEFPIDRMAVSDLDPA